MIHKIAIVGLGYVGLPLARLFATKYPVVGLDINEKRVEEINAGWDSTHELSGELLKSVLLTQKPFYSPGQFNANQSPLIENRADLGGLFCTSSAADIQDANTYIITVPTPVDKQNRPNLKPLSEASLTVGALLQVGDIVIYESTVYPGVTEEECVPLLEKASGLKFNQDFFCGYSPERINPGDREKTVDNILKVTSGSTPETGDLVDALYASIIKAGTYRAPSIRIAEASKVIENAQRDINIAFVNELAKIFSLMGLDTHEVLKASATKWNFLPFKPGLVGGHCIGVDPFYLAQKAHDIGYYSELILTARRVNDSMGPFIAHGVVKAMIKKNIQVNGAELLMLGVTFKENCADIRNTKVVDVVRTLEDYGIRVTIYDPWANPEEVKHEYGLCCHKELPRVEYENADVYSQKMSTLSEVSYPTNPTFDAIVLTVAHDEFLELNLNPYQKENTVVYDVKGVLQNSDSTL